MQGTEQFDELLKAVEIKADISAFLHCAMVAFGGPAGLAKLFREDFDALDAGSQGRIKIELALVDLMKGQVVEDEEFSNDEVTAMEQRMERLATERAKGNGDQ